MWSGSYNKCSFNIKPPLLPETDGIIVGADSIKIDLNGHTITGPDVTPDDATTPAVKDSSKVGIMVPNHNNVQIVDG